MAEYQIKELLTRGAGAEGTLLIPRTIYATLIEAVEKKRIPRELAAIYIGPAGIRGSSTDIDTADPDSMQVVRIAEGAPVPIQVEAYSTTNVKPSKYGLRPLITKEMQEDSQFDLIAHNLRQAGRRMADNETSLIITESLDSAANTVSGGATITIANITRGMQYLDDNDFQSTDFLIGPEVGNDLRNLDTFAEADKFGSREMQETGFVGRIYGMNIWMVSGNLITTTSSYIIDREQAFAIVEKRPVTIERYDDFTHDLSGVVITQRIKTVAIRTSAIAKITTT